MPMPAMNMAHVPGSGIAAAVNTRSRDVLFGSSTTEKVPPLVEFRKLAAFTLKSEEAKVPARLVNVTIAFHWWDTVGSKEASGLKLLLRSSVWRFKLNGVVLSVLDERSSVA